LALANGPDIGRGELGLTADMLTEGGMDGGAMPLVPMPALETLAAAAHGAGLVSAKPDDAAAAAGGTGAAVQASRPGAASPAAPVVRAVPAALTGSGGLPSDLVRYLDEVERDILERALDRHRYNRTAAGASLGLSLRQMRYRMARLGVGAAESDRGDVSG
jgi:DNA-binding NtrC family response regulator